MKRDRAPIQAYYTNWKNVFRLSTTKSTWIKSVLRPCFHKQRVTMYSAASEKKSDGSRRDVHPDKRFLSCMTDVVPGRSRKPSAFGSCAKLRRYHWWTSFMGTMMQKQANPSSLMMVAGISALSLLTTTTWLYVRLLLLLHIKKNGTTT